jgi:hypothetical protein
MKNRQELILEFMVAMSPRIFDLDCMDDEITAVGIRERAEILVNEYLETLR